MTGSPHEWLLHAESDLHLVRLAKGKEDILPEQVCFHAQQAVEKAIKGVLLFRKVEFPLVHDIEQLLEIAAQAGIQIPPDVSNASLLTPYAVEARYPGHLEEIEFSDVEEALATAEATIRWAKTIIK